MMSEKELREAIVKEAMTFVGTPYKDHAYIKGVGVDCASLAMLVMQASSVGIIPKDYVLPRYSPGQWLIKDVEDRAYLTEVLKFAVEIPEVEAQDGDLILYRLVLSYTHGTLITRLTTGQVIHAVKDCHEVILGNRFRDRVLKNRKKRFFSFVKKFLGK